MKTKMNVQLLRRVARVMKERYGQVEMEAWFDASENAPECGTMACIAGWTLAVKLAPPRSKPRPLDAVKTIMPTFGDGWFNRLNSTHTEKIFLTARRQLGLSPAQARRLFYADNWPYHYSDRLTRSWGAGKRKKYAAVVFQRIEHFIKTKGRE